jgi:hypothetical protein
MGFKLSKLGRRLVQHFDARAIRQKLKSQKLEIMGPVLLDILQVIITKMQNI